MKRGEVLAVPGDGPREALVEADARLPTGQCAQPRGVDPLAIDLARGRARALYVGAYVGVGRATDGLDDGSRALRRG